MRTRRNRLEEDAHSLSTLVGEEFAPVSGQGVDEGTVEEVIGTPGLTKMGEKNQDKYFYIGCATILGVAVGVYTLFGKRYNSMREVPMDALVAELGKRLR